MLYKKMRLKLMRRGFSLVELIVVLLLLGVLISVAVLRYTETTKTANLITFENNLKEIVKAIEAYKMLPQNIDNKYPVTTQSLS